MTRRDVLSALPLLLELLLLPLELLLLLLLPLELLLLLLLPEVFLVTWIPKAVFWKC